MDDYRLQKVSLISNALQLRERGIYASPLPTSPERSTDQVCPKQMAIGKSVSRLLSPEGTYENSPAF
jgi:hypothetical protein